MKLLIVFERTWLLDSRLSDQRQLITSSSDYLLIDRTLNKFHRNDLPCEKIQLKFYDFSIVNCDFRSISVSATCHIFSLDIFTLMINKKTGKKTIILPEREQLQTVPL